MPYHRLPNFLLIGAMKGGTTALYKLLCTRSDVYMPDIKEPDFFVAEKNWSKGFDWYRSLFKHSGDAIAVGEASTSYSKVTEFAGVAKRIHQHLPEVKLLYIIRSPVERMISMYLHNRLIGRETREINEAFLIDRIYLDASLYAFQLEQYEPFFNLNQIKLITSESLRTNPQVTLEAVEDFLCLPKGHTYPNESFYVTGTRRKETSLSLYIQRTGWYPTLIKHMPSNIKGFAKKLITTKPDAGMKVDLQSETLSYLHNILRNDLDLLQTKYGQSLPNDTWSTYLPD